MKPNTEDRPERLDTGVFVPPTPEELNALIPGFHFVEFLDQGGMGAVYKAVQKSLNRTVAVKLLPQVHRDKKVSSERFKREAQALGRLNHPHIVAVYDFGETSAGQMYYAMELVEGMDLRHLMKKGALDARTSLSIITQVCDALSFAHEHGIIHRDIKPGNILIDTRGVVKVADFGLAKVSDPTANYELSSASSTLGTPEYIAPEALIQGREVDHRADIFSLGVMIYEMLTGDVPKGVWEPPSQLGQSDTRLDDVVHRALQRDPSKRFQSVNDITLSLKKMMTPSEQLEVANLSRVANPALGRSAVHGNGHGHGHGSLSQGSTVAALAATPRKRRGRRLLAVGLVVLLLLTGGSWMVVQDNLPATEWMEELSKSFGSKGVPVTYLAPPTPPPPTGPTTEESQLKLARWVFDHAGFVNVIRPDQNEKIMGNSADIYGELDLPKGEYKVWRVCMSDHPLSEDRTFEELIQHSAKTGTVTNISVRGSSITPQALASLPKISETLVSLNLSQTPVLSGESVEHIATCKNLRGLFLSRPDPPRPSEDPEELTMRLQRLLPYCAIELD